ncbi:LysR family transcriptional regulator [Amycolatopsis taiwanensis]|uniref:LysR family transcriptional regulator n=1 Tax=Amycolatopsis taiwanensis TaxID=342230 RepID=UPI001B80B36B|nr:LysR family transcriptional regulator [Amycolatopsis taiwanensis]
MDFQDVSLVGLRVFREVAERGTLTAAAAALGYTQSAVSRQIAALERSARTPLLERRRDGVRLTSAGRIVLRRAVTITAEVDATARELTGLPAETGAVRLGAYASAGAVLVPRVLAAFRRTHPGIKVTTREAGTPVLVRALRAGNLDLALLAAEPPFRPPDTETPPLHLEILAERSLCVAVPATHPLAGRDFIEFADLSGQRWIGSRPAGDDRSMGVWPGLAGRPEIVHVARDWLAKLNLVAAGCGVTTVPVSLAGAAPAGVRILPVRGGPQEKRRIMLARMPHQPTESAMRLAEALRSAVVETSSPVSAT